MPVEIILIITLIFFSAFFSGTESAIFSLDSSKIYKSSKTKTTKDRRRLKKLGVLLKTPEKTLSAILFGNLIINIGLTDTTNHWLETSLGNIPNLPIISLAIITVTLLIFAEILPKVLALSINIKWSLFVTPILQPWVKISNIIARPINIFVETLISVLPNMRSRYSESEIIDSLRFAETQGLLTPQEKSTLNKYVTFHHDTAFSAMIPRAKISMLAHNASTTKARKHFQENRMKSPLDLILIYHAKDGKVLGYLNLKHIVLMHYKKLKSLAKKAIDILHVPETMPLREVMNTFIHNKKEVAIVLSEDGELSGVITLNLVLQKLIGNFSENEPHLTEVELGISPITKSQFILDGNLFITKFNDFFRTSFSSETNETISGFLLEHLDGFPQKGTKIEIDNLNFDNFKMEENRILTVRLTK